MNEHFEEDGAIVYREACRLGCQGIVSKRLGSPYRSGRSQHWVKAENARWRCCLDHSEMVGFPSR
jgi:bifunctional non-homologous end joining protein LigD